MLKELYHGEISPSERKAEPDDKLTQKWLKLSAEFERTLTAEQIDIVILLERQNNLKDLKSSRNSIIQRIVIMNMHSEPVLQGIPEIFNRIQFG